MVELVQILVPQKASEPYRNVKNNGLLLDLEEVGTVEEEKKEASPRVLKTTETELDDICFEVLKQPSSNQKRLKL